MAMKLFVGNLAWATTDADLEQAFDRFGEISEAKVIMDRHTGRSRGFGFVTFADDEAARAAIAEMNGVDLGGRPIRVNEAEDRGQRRPRGGFNERGGYGGDRERW